MSHTSTEYFTMSRLYLLIYYERKYSCPHVGKKQVIRLHLCAPARYRIFQEQNYRNNGNQFVVCLIWFEACTYGRCRHLSQFTPHAFQASLSNMFGKPVPASLDQHCWRCCVLASQQSRVYCTVCAPRLLSFAVTV